MPLNALKCDHLTQAGFKASTPIQLTIVTRQLVSSLLLLAKRLRNHRPDILLLYDMQ